MSKPTPNFHEAQQKFVEALHDYQTAARDMSLALQRVTTHTHAFYTPLKSVVLTSGSMITPRGLDR